MHPFLILFILTFLPLFAEVQKISIQGIERKYLIHVPLLPKEAKDVALVLMLHGAGGTAENASRQYGWIEKANRESFVIVFPEATPFDLSHRIDFNNNPNVWNDGSIFGKKGDVDDIAFLKAVIKEVTTKYPFINPSKVFMTGFSNGASMTFRAGIELSELISAIAPVSGHLWHENPNPKYQLSLLLITGDADPMNPLDGGKSPNPWNRIKADKPPMDDSIKKWTRILDLDEKEGHWQKVRGACIKQYGPNRQGKEILYVVVKGQGHEWPGGKRALPQRITGKNFSTYNATDSIWNFFKSQ